jgi:hypothetical protein
MFQFQFSSKTLSEKWVSKNNNLRKQFLSEEKNQETLAPAEIPVVSAMTSTLPQAQSKNLQRCLAEDTPASRARELGETTSTTTTGSVIFTASSGGGGPHRIGTSGS